MKALVAMLLALSPTMAGPPPAALGNPVLDYTMSIFLTAPTAGQQCTNSTYTTDQSGAITVSRASASYCQKQDGTMVLIDAAKLVVEPNGLRAEPSSTNRVAYSEDLNAGWTASNVTLAATISDPLGTATAQEWDDTSAGGLLTSPSFTITGTSAILSAWLQNNGSVSATLVLRDTTAGADRCTITVTAGTAFPATMAGRQSCSGSITTGNTHIVRFYPGGAAGSGAGASAFGVQVEPGLAAKTSYIPTTGTAASRAIDNITTTVADFDARGCVEATVTNTTSTYQAGTQRWFNSVAGSPLGFASSTGLTMHDNATAATLAVADVSNRAVTARSQWSGSVMYIEAGGVAGTAGTFDGTMGGTGVLTLGSAGSSASVGAWMQAIKFSTDPRGCR